MNDVDVSKIKVGDWASLKVVRLGSDGTVAVGGGWGVPVLVQAEAIVSHTPAPKPALKVGDRVVNPRSAACPEREVLLIQNGYVYLKPEAIGARLAPRNLSEVETWERV